MPRTDGHHAPHTDTMNRIGVAPANWPRPTVHLDLRACALFLAILGAGLAVWGAVVRAGLVSPLVPSPGEVWAATVAALRDPFYVRGTNSVGIGWHLLASLRRVLIGCGLAALVAIPLGFLLGASRTLSRAVDPFVQVLRPVSPLAWLPIGLAVLKDSQHTAVFVIFMAAVWPMLLNTILGVRAVPAAYVALARTVEAGRLTIARRILLPAALPSILTGVRLSLGMSWLVIVAAEMLIGGRGIGYFIWNNWNNLDVAAIVVAILVVGATGLVLDRAVRQLERLVAYD
jgi:nitrate/nitrite transport system permease protein